MKSHAKLYRKAAEIIDRRIKRGCCVAMDSATVRAGTVVWIEMRVAFRRMYEPDAPISAYWWEADEIQPRVLALLFAAAMAEAGDL